MASSDIIKIGFDYRSSLEQFEKDTNGVFDGISNKAGKQKITIQLDAKDDKIIEKIKELQKLKLDKFTFEFGNSGLKEQLQTFDKLENKINEIINLGKGKSFIDSSSTVADIGKIVQNTNNQAKAIDKVTNSYKNQAYELASVLKMLAKLDQYGDVPYAEAFSKAVKSGAKSYKNGDDIQFAAKKYGMDEESIKYLRGLSVNLSNAFNYTDTLGLDTANITNVEKLTEYFRELLKEKLEFNNTKLNTSDIEELIKALGIAKKELFDDGTKSGRNIYGDGTLDKYSDLPQIIQYLKQQETQAIATAEAEQKLAEAQKETASNTSNSNNSQIEELKSDIQEVKTELGDVKDRISSIESNGFENVREDVEKTKESVKELNSELTEMKSNLSSTPQESNISLGDSKEQSTEIDLYHNLEKRKVTYDEIIDKIQTIVSLKEKEKSLSKTSDDTKLYQNLYDENDINWAGDTEGTINRISDRLKEIYTKYNGKISLIDENDIQEATYLLDILKGSGESPNLNKSQEKFYQNKKFSNDSLFDNIRVDSQKAEEIDKINTELSETYRWFNQLEGVSLNENIANEIKSLISDMQIGGKTASEYANDLLKIFNIEVGSNSAVEQQNKLQSELKETESQAEKTAQAVNESSSTTPEKDLKDAFPNTDTKLDEAVISAKDLDKTLKQVDIPTDSFDKVLEKLDRTKSELVDIVKITKQSVSDKDGKFHDSYTLKDNRGSTEIYGTNSKTDKGQILRQNIVGYDVKKDTVDNSKELLAIEKQLQKEIEASDKANQKKFQDFQKEQADYAESVNKVNSAIQKTDEILDTLPLHDKLDGQFLDMIDSVDNLNSKLKSGELTLSEYKNEVKSVTSEYSKMVSIQQKRDVEDYNANAKANLENAKNIQAEWDKNIKAIQDYMDAMTKLNNLKAKDKGTGSEENQIALQIQNVEELKQTAWDARQNLSSIQAENPDIIAWKQWVDMMELFDQASKGSAESAAKLKDVLDNIKVPSLDKYENKLVSYQTKKGAYDATIARFKDGGWTSDKYLKNVQAVKDAVKKYEDLLSNIKAKGGITSEEDVQKLKEYESEIKKTISTVTNMSAAEKGYNFVSAQKELDKIHKLLNENSKMSSKAKAKIQAYYREIESGNPSMSLDKIHGKILKIYNAEVEAGRVGKSLWDTFKTSRLHQIVAQAAGMFGVYDVINLGKQAFSTVKELDYALVDLKKTTAMNSSELEQFYYDSNDVAKQMGVTTKEIIDQASSWSRLGYNSKQAATEMAKLSSQFSLISPGMDTTTAQEGLVSIMKAWDIGYQDVKSQIMDDINALGNAMAEDNQDIVEGMERSAAALAAVGTSTKDAFALFSGIQEVLQNSEKSGTSLRSVALRLRSFDETTGEYSEDLANITGELADLTKTAEHAQGVSVFKPGSTTEFKSLVDYFREIADIWDEMSQKQQNDFLLKAFGRTQAQAGAALIQNFKGVEKALDVMDNAAGSADKEMETAKQSITYKLNELKETWVGTVQDIANRDDLGRIVDGLIDLSSAIGFVIDKLGLAGTVGLFGGAGAGIFKFIKNFDWVFKPYTKTLSNSF